MMEITKIIYWRKRYGGYVRYLADFNNPEHSNGTEAVLWWVVNGLPSLGPLK